jgi:hypothetical protein
MLWNIQMGLKFCPKRCTLVGVTHIMTIDWQWLLVLQGSNWLV